MDVLRHSLTLVLVPTRSWVVDMLTKQRFPLFYVRFVCERCMPRFGEVSNGSLDVHPHARTLQMDF